MWLAGIVKGSDGMGCEGVCVSVSIRVCLQE